ncbi:oxamate carbamoyltransferase subunit AllH family protein [Phycicoccus flavus]|uniref:oxamate carbamoyltransferase subunit AllH family protein n=1 Tax=Phycicoccus flavus TaxID=2502783 RepID=UPI000FEBD1AC|nr:DUF2877 domain-containing protein [Phycicoccus flavus]NHA66665.1 DUF2877 domain-containing protein [Phycicoccus flavus]
MPSPTASARPVALPGALSPLTADLVRGPRRPAVVLAAPRVGVYLGVGDRVLPVLAADALALPGAVRLGVTSAHLDLRAGCGDVVVVGAGCVRLPGPTVRGVRTWRPARVRRGTPPSEAAARAVLDLLAGALGDAPGWLAAGIARALRGAPEAVATLLGRGPGLTPSGDDAVAGALLVRRALGHDPRPGRADGPRRDPRDRPDAADPLAAAVRSRLTTTTAVSAALLDAAAGGWATHEAVDLAEAAARGDVAGVTSALPAVLAVGHTSGRDLVAGVAAALDTLVLHGRTAA